eukprot:13474088-Ditylum_brightwellii.AAC.1
MVAKEDASWIGKSNFKVREEEEERDDPVFFCYGLRVDPCQGGDIFGALHKSLCYDFSPHQIYFRLKFMEGAEAMDFVDSCFLQD